MPTLKFKVPSRSKQNVKWTVFFKNGAFQCECPGFVYRGRCWHVDRVRRIFKESEGKKEKYPTIAEKYGITFVDSSLRSETIFVFSQPEYLSGAAVLDKVIEKTGFSLISHKNINDAGSRIKEFYHFGGRKSFESLIISVEEVCEKMFVKLVYNGSNEDFINKVAIIYNKDPIELELKDVREVSSFDNVAHMEIMQYKRQGMPESFINVAKRKILGRREELLEKLGLKEKEVGKPKWLYL